MKKFVSVIMVIVSLFAFTSAIAATKEELIATINQARLELTQYYEPVVKGTVLYEDENVKVTATSTPHSHEYMEEYFVVDVIIENYTDKNIRISFENVSANGWTIDGDGVAIAANKKAKGEFEFYHFSDTDFNSPEEVEELEGTLYYFDTDSYDTIGKGDFLWLFE